MAYADLTLTPETCDLVLHYFSGKQRLTNIYLDFARGLERPPNNSNATTLSGFSPKDRLVLDYTARLLLLRYCFEYGSLVPERLLPNTIATLRFLCSEVYWATRSMPTRQCMALGKQFDLPFIPPFDSTSNAKRVYFLAARDGNVIDAMPPFQPGQLIFLYDKNCTEQEKAMHMSRAVNAVVWQDPRDRDTYIHDTPINIPVLLEFKFPILGSGYQSSTTAILAKNIKQFSQLISDRLFQQRPTLSPETSLVLKACNAHSIFDSEFERDVNAAYLQALAATVTYKPALARGICDIFLSWKSIFRDPQRDGIRVRQFMLMERGRFAMSDLDSIADMGDWRHCMLQLLLALYAMNSMGMVHNDVKPDNIMFFDVPPDKTGVDIYEVEKTDGAVLLLRVPRNSLEPRWIDFGITGGYNKSQCEFDVQCLLKSFRQMWGEVWEGDRHLAEYKAISEMERSFALRRFVDIPTFIQDNRSVFDAYFVRDLSTEMKAPGTTRMRKITRPLEVVSDQIRTQMINTAELVASVDLSSLMPRVKEAPGMVWQDATNRDTYIHDTQIDLTAQLRKLHFPNDMIGSDGRITSMLADEVAQKLSPILSDRLFQRHPGLHPKTALVLKLGYEHKLDDERLALSINAAYFQTLAATATHEPPRCRGICDVLLSWRGLHHNEVDHVLQGYECLLMEQGLVSMRTMSPAVMKSGGSWQHVLIQLLTALYAMYSLGMVHRDVALRNIVFFTVKDDGVDIYELEKKNGKSLFLRVPRYTIEPRFIDFERAWPFNQPDSVLELQDLFQAFKVAYPGATAPLTDLIEYMQTNYYDKSTRFVDIPTLIEDHKAIFGGFIVTELTMVEKDSKFGIVTRMRKIPATPQKLHLILEAELENVANATSARLLGTPSIASKAPNEHVWQDPRDRTTYIRDTPINLLPLQKFDFIVFGGGAQAKVTSILAQDIAGKISQQVSDRLFQQHPKLPLKQELILRAGNEHALDDVKWAFDVNSAYLQALAATATYSNPPRCRGICDVLLSWKSVFRHPDSDVVYGREFMLMEQGRFVMYNWNSLKYAGEWHHLLLQLLLAMHVMHSMGIVHRDVNYANVVFFNVPRVERGLDIYELETKDGKSLFVSVPRKSVEPRFIDFGLAGPSSVFWVGTDVASLIDAFKLIWEDEAELKAIEELQARFNKQGFTDIPSFIERDTAFQAYRSNDLPNALAKAKDVAGKCITRMQKITERSRKDVNDIQEAELVASVDVASELPRMPKYPR